MYMYIYIHVCAAVLHSTIDVMWVNCLLHMYLLVCMLHGKLYKANFETLAPVDILCTAFYDSILCTTNNACRHCYSCNSSSSIH